MPSRQERALADNDIRTELLQGTLEQLMAMRGVRHAIMAVESCDGSWRWAGAKGERAKYRIRYSDTNYQLLIAIVETVLRKPIEDAYRETFFESLKLLNTSCQAPSRSRRPGQRLQLIGHTGALGSWLCYCPERDLILAGTVSQLTAAAAPFRVLPKLLEGLRRSA